MTTTREPEIHIRRATVADVPIITEFNAMIAKETENLDLDRLRLMSGVHALFDDPSKGFYIVAEIDGAVAGQLMITYEWSDWRNGSNWWIQSVYVHPDYRAKGVFTALYTHIEKEARATPGVSGLRLYVDRHNERAQRAYQRLGMSKSEYELFEVDFVLSRSRN
jgi:ribosomal protein S18 acetylase RimI-like enzyme